MILRKPYAFFIKHFKLFNIILTILELYVIYKLSFLVKFFFDYSSYPQGAVGQNLRGTLTTISIFVVPAIALGFSILLTTVLSVKKKPVKIYLFSIIINFALLIILFICYNMLSIVEMQVIESRTAYAMRDILLISTILEVFMAILTGMRSVGFDIKSFRFGQDLEELNIDTTDNEEFELQIDIDSGNLKRNFNKNKRQLKYFIYENKLALILIGTAIIGFGSYFISSRMGIYFNITKPNKMVSVDNFSLGVKESYLTQKDYKNSKIVDDKYLLVVPIKIKTNSIKEKLNIARFELVISDHKFYHTTKYKEKLVDLGNTYNDNILDTNFSDYILVFEVPLNYKNKKMYLQYRDESDKTLKFEIKKDNLDEIKNTFTNNLGEVVNFNNELIEEGTLKINSIEIADKFKVDYKFCLSNDECYNSYEYIIPNYKSNYDKTILKLDGKINLEKSKMNINDLYDLISDYTTLIYTINGETKTQNVAFARVLPQRTKLNNVYYIEVLDEVKNAESISLRITLRDNVYLYKLK